jgi:hypothetical protein
MNYPKNIKKLRSELKKAGFSLTIKKHRQPDFSVTNSEGACYLVYSYDWSESFMVIDVYSPVPHRESDPRHIRSAFLHVINCPD